MLMLALGSGLGLSADGPAVQVWHNDLLVPEARLAAVVGHLDFQTTRKPVESRCRCAHVSDDTGGRGKVEHVPSWG